MATQGSLITEKVQRGHRSKAPYWALAAVFLAVYVGSMFTPGLLDDADSTHAEAAREMVVSGDYVTLHINGVRYLEKAPLPYWLVAFSYKIFGVNEFSTRLPMVLSVMLLGVLAFCWGRRRVWRADRHLCGVVRLYLRGRVFVHASFDSGCAAKFADCVGCVLFSDGARTGGGGLAMVCGLRDDGAGRAYEGIDRTGVPRGRGVLFSAGDGRVAEMEGVSAAFRLRIIFGDCRAVAHTGWAAKSGDERASRVFVVLFRQRTLSEISG